MTEPAPAIGPTAPATVSAGLAPGNRTRFLFFLVFLALLYVPGFILDPNYRLPQFNRFLALALFALSVDLI